MAQYEDWSLSKWPVFSLLSETFLRSLKLVCVFGASGSEAIVVTHDDQVYALGSNNNGCLGVGDLSASFEPRKIKELCNQGIIDVTFGSGPHVVALTSDGRLFSWGHDGYGQLGRGIIMTTTPGTSPQLIRREVQRAGNKITQVACGGHHTLALTTDKQVLAWGFNNSGQIGTGDTHNQTLPRKVEGIMAELSFSSVVCGNTSSYALSTNGGIYCWGYNGNGQLGLGTNTSHFTPVKVHLDDVVFKKVVCGYAHVLALSENGGLYTWGSNMHGQLGTGTKSNLLIPRRIASDLGSFVEIAACHNNHLSGASVLTGKVYMWGLCRGQAVLSPLLTKLSCVDDIFAGFGAPPSTWRILAPSGEESNNLVRCIGDRFDDVSTSDLTVLVDGRQIHVHKAILKMRCEYFQSMFQQGRWTEADKDCIEMTQFSYPVYHAFLKYLYTDKLEQLSMEETLGLLELADSYCEKELKKQCEKFVWQSVTISNVATLLTVASKYQTSALEEQCLSFALNHMTQVVQSESFEQLDSTLAKEFIKKAAERGAFKT